MDQNEELKKLLEQAIHSRNDPRLASITTVPNDNIETDSQKRTTKKRQCANCTCKKSNGCSDKKSQSNNDVSPKIKNGCGSCNLGDAFRCSGCPYRGMPAFKEGEEFKFDENLNDL